jgi:hypothetical protein
MAPSADKVYWRDILAIFPKTTLIVILRGSQVQRQPEMAAKSTKNGGTCPQ